MDISAMIAKSKFCMIILHESQYLSKLQEIVKSVEKTPGKICYICLNNPYLDVKADLLDKGIDVGKFFFIDTLASKSARQDGSDCIFLRSAGNLQELRLAINRAVEEKMCRVLMFDTISTLLIYQQSSSILSFTHKLMTGMTQSDVRKLFIVLKDEEVPGGTEALSKDLGMFADQMLDMTSARKEKVV